MVSEDRAGPAAAAGPVHAGTATRGGPGAASPGTHRNPARPWRKRTGGDLRAAARPLSGEAPVRAGPSELLHYSGRSGRRITSAPAKEGQP